MQRRLSFATNVQTFQYLVPECIRQVPTLSGIERGCARTSARSPCSRSSDCQSAIDNTVLVVLMKNYCFKQTRYLLSMSCRSKGFRKTAQKLLPIRPLTKALDRFLVHCLAIMLYDQIRRIIATLANLRVHCALFNFYSDWANCLCY